MQNSDRHAFLFARDWTHAGVTYARGDTTELPAIDVEKLTRLGAGAPPERTTEKPDPPKGKKAPTPPV